jgi:hypothetical protein
VSRAKQPATVHLVFSAAAELSVNEVLWTLERDEPVIAIEDDLGVGPIASWAERDRWLVRQYEDNPWSRLDDELLRRLNPVQRWRLVASARVDPIVWISRRCASERCGLLELVRRRAAPPRIIDVSELTLNNGYVPVRVGVIPTETLLDHGVIDRPRRLTEHQVSVMRRRWDQLRHDNAPARIVRGGRLISSSLRRFDAAILACVTTEWARTFANLGTVVARFAVDLVFVVARIYALVAAGSLELRGGYKRLHRTQIRRTLGAAQP